MFALNYMPPLPRPYLPSQEAFDALQLATLCNQTRPAPAPTPQVVRRAAPREADTVVYVDGVQGSDSNPGTQAKPLKTLAAGVQMTRGKARPAAVMVKPATYVMDSPLQLTSADSNLSIIAEQPGVWLSGAEPLPALSWAPYNISNASLSVLQNQNNARGCARDDPSDPKCGCHVTQTLDACEQAAISQSTATSFTWHDQHQGVWCFFFFFLKFIKESSLMRQEDKAKGQIKWQDVQYDGKRGKK